MWCQRWVDSQELSFSSSLSLHPHIIHLHYLYLEGSKPEKILKNPSILVCRDKNSQTFHWHHLAGLPQSQSGKSVTNGCCLFFLSSLKNDKAGSHPRPFFMFMYIHMHELRSRTRGPGRLVMTVLLDEKLNWQPAFEMEKARQNRRKKLFLLLLPLLLSRLKV